MTIRFKLFVLFCIVFNVFATQKVAAHPTTANHPLAKDKQTIFEMLSREDPLEITIATNLTDLIENRRTEDYLPAKFSYENREGQSITRDIEVQPRGKFRRRVCDFPPVRLKFAKKDLESEGLVKDHNKLKLVTHCIDEKSIGNDNLLKEYLIYQLYNELTSNSFRVQLVRITYEDTEGKLGKIKRYGILIEDTDEMAERLGGKEFEVMNPSKDSISQKDEAMMAMFQYMIANADWTTEMLRNVKLVLPKGGSQVIPVPYDFDFSGLVNASYAIPNSNFGLLTIRDRVYMGYFKDQALLKETIAHFIQRKEALFETVKSFKLLSSESRTDVTNFLQTFYAAVEPAYADASVDLYSFLMMRNATLSAWKQAQLNGSMGSANK